VTAAGHGSIVHVRASERERESIIMIIIIVAIMRI